MLPIPQLLNPDDTNSVPSPSMLPYLEIEAQQDASTGFPGQCNGHEQQFQSMSPSSLQSLPHPYYYSQSRFSFVPSPSERSFESHPPTSRTSSHTPNISSNQGSGYEAGSELEPSSDSDPDDEQVTFYIGPRRTCFTMSRKLAISSSRKLAARFTDPKRMLNTQYSSQETTPEAFELWQEYVLAPCVYMDRDKKEFPRVWLAEVDSAMRDVGDMDSLTLQGRVFLRTLFELWYLGERFWMPTLQNDVVKQIVSFSRQYRVLPAWSMLSEEDRDWQDTHGQGSTDYEGRKLRNLLVDMWLDLEPRELNMMMGMLQWWPQSVILELFRTREDRRSLGIKLPKGLDPEDERYMLVEDEMDPEDM